MSDISCSMAYGIDTDSTDTVTTLLEQYLGEDGAYDFVAEHGPEDAFEEFILLANGFVTMNYQELRELDTWSKERYHSTRQSILDSVGLEAKIYGTYDDRYVILAIKGSAHSLADIYAPAEIDRKKMRVSAEWNDRLRTFCENHGITVMEPTWLCYIFHSY